MAQFARPDSDTTITGAWTNEVGGTTNLFASIDEVASSDADYIESENNPDATALYEAGLSNVTDPASSSSHIIRYRMGKNTTAGRTINVVVALYQGTTLIASWTHNNIDALTSYSQTLTGTQADAISDYTNLRFRFNPTVSGGGGSRKARIAWIELEVPNFTGPQTVVAQLISNTRVVSSPTVQPGGVSVVAQLLAQASQLYNPNPIAVVKVPFIEMIGTDYNQTVMALNPVGYWRLGEASGATTLAAEIGSSLTGGAGTPPTSVAGALAGDSNTALQGSGDWGASLAGQLVSATSASLVVWWKTPASTGPGHQYVGGVRNSSDADLFFVLLDTGVMECRVRTATGNTDVNFTPTLDGGWHMLALTWDGSDARSYLDGVLQTGPTARTGTMGSGPMALFADPTFSVSPSAYALDEVALFTTALTATQISDLYDIGTGAGGIVVADSFTGTDGTALNGRAPDTAPASRTWSGSTDITIQSNTARSATAFKSIGIDSGISAGYVEADVGDFSTSGDTRLALLFRMGASVSSTNRWIAFVYRTGDGGFRRVGLQKVVAGTGTELIAIDPGAISATGPHTLRAEFDGDQIAVFWNGVQIGTTQTDSALQTNTWVGIDFANGGGGYVDNYEAGEAAAAGGVYNPTVTPPVSVVVTQLVANSPVLYNPGVPIATQSVVVPILENGVALYSPQVSQQVVSQLIDLVESIYSPIIKQQIIANLAVATTTTHIPQVNATNLIVAQLLTQAYSLFAPTVTPGAVNVVVNTLTQAPVAHDPTISPAGISVVAELITITPVAFDPAASPGEVVIDVDTLVNNSLAYDPQVVQKIISEFLSQSSAAYSPQILQKVITEALSNTTEIYDPTVLPGGIQVIMDLLSSSGVAYQPTVSVGALSVVAQSISQPANFFDPSVVPGGVQVLVDALTQAGVAIEPRVTTGEIFVLPEALANGSGVYNSIIFSDQVIEADTIAPSPQVLTPAVAAGALTVISQLIQNPASVIDPQILQRVMAGFLNNPTSISNPKISQSILADLISQGITLYLPGILTAAVVGVDTLDSGYLGFTPQVSSSGVQIGVEPLENLIQIIAPLVTIPGQILEVDGLQSVPVVELPSVLAGPLTIQAASLTATPIVYGPDIYFDQFVVVGVIDNPATLNGPRLFIGVVPTNYQWDSNSEFSQTQKSDILTGHSELRRTRE